jgi:hypothetical protein
MIVETKVSRQAMGSEVFARCACGLNETIAIGSGMSDFPRVCLFPALCRHCNQLAEADLGKSPPRCPECHGGELVPYSGPALSAGDGDEIVTRWGDLALYDGHYHCPGCGRMTLQFMETGLRWD